MPRFFCNNIIGDKITIDKPDALHIKKVLRMKIGENLIVSDLLGFDYDCEIIDLLDEEVILKINNKIPCKNEPSLNLTLYQALPKNDKFDLIVQKAVELGASKIVPVTTKRCVSKWDEKSKTKKQQRLQKIALEAAKQSGRGIIPQIGELLSFKEAIQQMQANQTAIICYEKYGQRLNEIVDSDCDNVAIMVGSEGGFEEEEILFAKSNNINIASLGNLILRCETAPICAISIIMNITKNI